jgi:hypothetical protein
VSHFTPEGKDRVPNEAVSPAVKHSFVEGREISDRSTVMTLPQQISSTAKSIVNSLVQTDYQHIEHIDPVAGIYDCDCNGFVGFVLDTVAPAHYHLIPKEKHQQRPRAFKYFGFFASLTPESMGGWQRIDFLRDARAGDVISWRAPTIEHDENTGHVLFVAAPPTIDAAGIYSICVYDSADKPHFDDTRGSGAGEFPTGVGSGIIKFNVDGAGRPTGFLFAPPASAEFTFLQTAIGRAVQ